MYPCVMNCKVIILCDLCLQYDTAQCGLVTDNVRYRIAHSSVCRRLQINVIYVTVRFVTIACRKDTCHEIVKKWCRGINICRVGGVAHDVKEGKTLCNVFLTFKISVIQVLLQLQKGSRNFIKILGISLADSNETFPFKFCNRDHQRRRDKRNQNVNTWNPQYGFKLTKSRRKMLLLGSHRYQFK